MHKPLHLYLLLFLSCVVSAKDILKFDFHGDLIPPDQVHLSQGLEHDKDGFKNLAIKSFKKSARFGNEHAKFFLGMLLMQKDNYIEAYGWLSSVDGIRINRADKIDYLMTAIKQNLTADQYNQATKNAEKIKKLYNPMAASIHRNQWVDNQKYIGSRIKGNIPGGAKIFVNASFEFAGPDGIPRISGTHVNESSLRSNLNDFIYSYTYDLPANEVKLNDIELVDKKQGDKNQESN